MSRPPTPTPPLPTITTAFTSPPRSSTLPPKQHRHHHHPRRSHHHHPRRHDRSVPQSAIERTTPNPFGELLKGEWPRRRGSNGSDTHGSAPTSLRPHDHESSDYDGAAELLRRKQKQQKEAAEEEARKRQWMEVSRLRNRRQEGEEELRKTLSHLNDISTKMTRRLDYMYYALLTSLSNLTSSVNAFLALAQQSKQTYGGFVSQAGELEREASVSVRGTMETLDRQAERVVELQERMKRGQDRVGGLGTRLERVRERVEEAERRDREQRRRVGRRLRMLWAFGGCWLSILVVGLIMRQWGPRPNLNTPVTKALVHDETNQPASENLLVSEMMASNIESSRLAVTPFSVVEQRVESSSAVDAEAILRLLEDL